MQATFKWTVKSRRIAGLLSGEVYVGVSQGGHLFVPTKGLQRSADDWGLPPPPGDKGQSSFRRGDVLIGRNKSAGFGMMDRNKKPLRLTDAQVEVEFVVNTNGTVWGDGKSPTYLRM